MLVLLCAVDGGPLSDAEARDGRLRAARAADAQLDAGALRAGRGRAGLRSQGPRTLRRIRVSHAHYA